MAADHTVLQLMVSGAPLPRVLETLAREIEAESADSMRCSIYLLDDSPRPPGLAARHGERVCYSAPVASSEGELLGAIAVSYEPARSPSAAEREAIGRAAHLASIAIARQRAESALRQSEQRLRALLTATSDVVYRMSADWSEMLQLDGQAFLADTEEPSRDWLSRYILPEDQPRVTQAIKQAMRTKGIFALEHRVRRADGAVGWAYSRAIPVLDAHGDILEWYGAASNITERKLAGERLRDSEEQLREIVNHAAGGIAIADESGRFLFVNQKYCQIVGRTAEALLAMRMQDITPEDDLRRNLPLFDRLVREGLPFDIEKRYLRPDGSHVWVRNSVSRLAGRPTRVLAISMDVTDDVLARQRTAESERRWRFVMDSMAQKIFTATPDGDVDYFNSVWMEFTGLSFEQIRDWGWTTFIHPDDVEQNVRVWRRSIETGEPFQFEHRFRRADGQYRWHLSRAVALKDHDGKVLMWVGSNTDIHEQKETANELRRLAEDLAVADRRKDEFLATLAHELRNPLAPIRNSLSILRLPGVTAVAAEGLHEMMERQVAHMVRLVDDLLEMSRITRGKIELRKDRVELAAVLRTAIETSQPALDAATHRLSIALPSEPVWLEADAVRLAQVFSNLLNNAAKYTEPGGQIWLSARREEHDIVVSVRDNGVGIPADMLPKVFEMFTQVNRHLKRAQGGLGIGLTLARQLVGMHGGFIEARSAGAGQGSEFVVRLPATVGDHRPSHRPGERRHEPAQARRVLVVDDNRDAADTLCTLLRAMGADARATYDGPTALAIIRAERPHTVLLDLGMPGMDGYEVARLVRSDGELRNISLVALTGWGQDEDRRRSREAGFDMHLVKPAAHDELRNLLSASPAAASTGA